MENSRIKDKVDEIHLSAEMNSVSCLGGSNASSSMVDCPDFSEKKTGEKKSWWVSKMSQKKKGEVVDNITAGATDLCSLATMSRSLSSNTTKSSKSPTSSKRVRISSSSKIKLCVKEKY